MRTAPRDPAALPRLALTLLALALLWPGLRLSELNLAVLFDPGSASS
ncbi:MAG: ABC transporter permease, partial [Pseudomonas sp.]